MRTLYPATSEIHLKYESKSVMVNMMVTFNANMCHVLSHGEAKNNKNNDKMEMLH